MKRTLLWAATCLLPIFVIAQTSLEQKLRKVLSELKTPDATGYAYLPRESEIAGFTKNESTISINLKLPVNYLDRELDGETVDEIIEHFATTMSEFGFQSLQIKALNEFGLYDELSNFLHEEFQVYAPVKPNEDPSPDQFGRKGIDNYSDVQPKGQLQDATIWLSAGHGWVYDKRRNSFKTQRSNHHGIVEDFSNIEWVNYHLLPYLYNAGANVWSVRERDMNANEIIVDNDDKGNAYQERGKWYTSRTRGYGSRTYRYTTSDDKESAVAIFQPEIRESGRYWVSVRYIAGPNRSVDARYRIVHAGGVSRVSINQEVHNDTWVYLGQFYFEKGRKGKVILSNASDEQGQAIIADAVRFGGGMGSVPDCDFGRTSKEPRYEEGAKYYAAFQGFSQCINDVSIRPKYAEWEQAKGTQAERENAIYLSWHSNGNGSTGTESYVHSRNKVRGCWSLQKYVHEQIISDIRRGYDKNWKDRGKKSADFGELRGLRTMPGLLVEIGFHDHAGDAKALSEPYFRDLTARATYKGIVQYFAKKQGRQPVYLPEPPTHLIAVNDPHGNIQISWKTPVHGGIYGHPAEAYKVYLSHHGKAFSTGIFCQKTHYTINNPEPDKVYFVRVTATNGGGESFPTTVVAVKAPERKSEEVSFLIVDGFDRLDRNQAIFARESSPSYAPLGMTRRLWIEQMNAFNYASAHAEPLAGKGISFDGATNEAVIAGKVNLSDYKTVNWFLGSESVRDKTLDAKEQALLKSYLDQGGNLMISGSELGFDLVQNKNGASFYKNYLKADFKGDDAGMNRLLTYSDSHFDPLGVDYRKNDHKGFPFKTPDHIYPNGGSEAILEYGNGKTAAIAYQGKYSLLYFAFPLEAINDAQFRESLFQQSLSFFNELPPGPVIETNSDIIIAKFPGSIKNNLQLNMQNLTEGTAMLKLTTVMGSEVFRQQWSHDGRSNKMFDLRNLPRGLINYEFEINGQLQVGYFRKE